MKKYYLVILGFGLHGLIFFSFGSLWAQDLHAQIESSDNGSKQLTEEIVNDSLEESKADASGDETTADETQTELVNASEIQEPEKKPSIIETFYRQREIDRYHSDTKSYDTTVFIDRTSLFGDWEISSAFALMLSLDNTNWTLKYKKQKDIIKAQLTHIKPSLRYRFKDLTVDVKLLSYQIEFQDSLYERIEEDDQTSFQLPEYSVTFDNKKFRLKSYLFQEPDFQIMSYNRYMMTVQSTLAFGAGYYFTDDQLVYLESSTIDRFYPEEFSLDKNETLVSYQFKNPLNFMEKLSWFVLDFSYKQIKYPDSTNSKGELINAFKYSGESLTHFLTYTLKYDSVVTEYQSSDEEEQISESYPEKDAYTHNIQYSGFTKLGSSRFYLSWRALVGASINEESYGERLVELKLDYVF